MPDVLEASRDAPSARADDADTRSGVDLDALLEAAFGLLLPRRRRFPPLFVVGAPRSGTTLAYQLLLNRFRFAYLPNAANRHPRAPSLAVWRHKLAHGVPVTWESDYGVVSGSMAPADGRPVLRRWLPEFDQAAPPGRGRFHELEALVARLERVLGGPFVNKSNPLSMFVPLLVEVFPDALFLHVRRDPSEATVSLLEARRAHGVPTGTWWGAVPPQYRHLRCASELEQAARTVVGAEAWIAARLGELPQGRATEVSYPELCARPAELAENVRALFARAGVGLRERPTPLPARLERRSRLELDPDRERLAQQVRGWIERLHAEDVPLSRCDAGVATG